jgi:acyl transferase domain-containing protein
MRQAQDEQCLLHVRAACAQVPHQRWDLEQYYSPEARGDLTMYARGAAFVAGLDEFDASLFRQPHPSQSMENQTSPFRAACQCA